MKKREALINKIIAIINTRRILDRTYLAASISEQSDLQRSQAGLEELVPHFGQFKCGRALWKTLDSLIRLKYFAAGQVSVFRLKKHREARSHELHLDCSVNCILWLAHF